MRTKTISNNITWHNGCVAKKDRAKQKDQKPCLVWFAGLSRSGKSTVAAALEKCLIKEGGILIC